MDTLSRPCGCVPSSGQYRTHQDKFVEGPELEKYLLLQLLDYLGRLVDRRGFPQLHQHHQQEQQHLPDPHRHSLRTAPHPAPLCCSQWAFYMVSISLNEKKEVLQYDTSTTTTRLLYIGGCTKKHVAESSTVLLFTWWRLEDVQWILSGIWWTSVSINLATLPCVQFGKNNTREACTV